MNEDPNYNRRLILAFALSMIVFVLVARFGPKAPPKPPSTPASAALAPPPAQKPAAPKPAPPPPAAAAAASAVKANVTIAAAAAASEVVDTPVYHVVFSNEGANVRSWILKNYGDANGHPLDAVDAGYGAAHGYPLSLYSADPQLRAELDQALFTVTRSGGPDAQALRFEWSSNGLHAVKTFTFGSGYEIDVSSELTRGGEPVAAGFLWPGGLADRGSANDFSSEQLILLTGDKLQMLAPKKVESGTVVQGSFPLAGVEDQFFAAIFLPRDVNANLAVTQLKTSYRPPWLGGSGSAVDLLGIAVSGGARNEGRLFVGPKQVSLLKSVDPILGKLVDFGFFSVVAEPLFVWMNWTYQHWFHNYGWVIIFITFVLTMAMLPLKFRAQKSQMKMLALQPKMNALNAKMKKYKARDPRRQEVQQEIMKLYSDNGVNPAAGCLPMLPQLPLLWAFYRVLGNAIELRHAPWIGYLHDLSAKDPYYLLPIVLVASQFLSMQLMPTAPGQDPRQARMMKYLMPAFMGYIFFYLPSGVNLYYLASNLIGVAQQVWINRIYGLRPAQSTARRAPAR